MDAERKTYNQFRVQGKSQSSKSWILRLECGFVQDKILRTMNDRVIKAVT